DGLLRDRLGLRRNRCRRRRFNRFGWSLRRNVTYWNTRLCRSSTRGNGPSAPLQYFHFACQFRQLVVEILCVASAAAINNAGIDQRRKRYERPDNQAQE